jgi:hypothetical protein
MEWFLEKKTCTANNRHCNSKYMEKDKRRK